MSKITFVYMKRKYPKIITELNALISKEIEIFSSTLEIPRKNLYFLYHGLSLKNTKKKFSDFKKKNLLIYVFNLKKILKN